MARSSARGGLWASPVRHLEPERPRRYLFWAGNTEGYRKFMNHFRTGLLLAALTGLFVAIGFLIGGEGGMLIAFGIAVAMNFFAYWNSDKMVLSMYGAQEVDRNSAPGFYGIVAQLAERAGIPMPRVYVIESDQPNAFATGRSPEHAA